MTGGVDLILVEEGTQHSLRGGTREGTWETEEGSGKETGEFWTRGGLCRPNGGVTGLVHG